MEYVGDKLRARVEVLEKGALATLDVGVQGGIAIMFEELEPYTYLRSYDYSGAARILSAGRSRGRRCLAVPASG